ncbi:nucleolin 1-like isoform X3 [Papaver somniferum]|uniref:nucleolin 1-like isoform X3 n=1 Tax=Papaver somniferum TaxID=3469 RepID=UPI000E6F896D|nr:nucleolin 1-like isoform X3 [Papaver somniferum]
MFNSNSYVCLILQPTTPSAPQVQSTEASKTVTVRNIPFSIHKSDLIEFYKQAGEVVYACYDKLHSGSCHIEYKGSCHIEFATEEAAKKALKLDGQNLCNWEIVVGRYGTRTTGASKTLIAKHYHCSLLNLMWSSSLNGLGKLLMCVSLHLIMENSVDIAILSLQLKKVWRRKLS